MVRKLLNRIFNPKPPSVHISIEFDGRGIMTALRYTNNHPVYTDEIPFEEDPFEDADFTDEQMNEILSRVHPSQIAKFVRAYNAGTDTYEGLMKYFGDGHPDDEDIV